jgi:hypothetical protein
MNRFIPLAKISERTSIQPFSPGKINISLIAILLFFVSTAAAPGTGNTAILRYNGQELHASGKELTVDFGRVQQGAVCAAVISIKNESDQVLQIVNVRGSCGLTAPSWPRRPIQPGQEATIQVRYDSSRQGSIDRNLTINANTGTSVTVIKITGEIVAR